MSFDKVLWDLRQRRNHLSWEMVGLNGEIKEKSKLIGEKLNELREVQSAIDKLKDTEGGQNHEKV